MSWSIRYASEIIGFYATIDPAASDAVLLKLDAARRDGRVA